MELAPIFRALLRNKLGMVLVVMQIAFTMTVMINAIFIINERARLMARPSGLEEANLFYFTSVGFGDDFNEEITLMDDLNLLRQLPGVVDATISNSIPVSGSGSSTGVRLVNDETQPAVGAAYYQVDEHALNTMNLNLIAGENFTANDVRSRNQAGSTIASKTVISEALSIALYPDTAATDVVGRTLFVPGGQELQIVGIVERLQAPWPTSSIIEHAMLFPENFVNGTTMYLIRTEPGERDRVMARVEDLLATNNDSRVIRGLRSLEQTRTESYRVDSAMSSVLKVIVATLVFITCMGIVGLAVFGINRRRKQIGTRRALGATRQEILRYFMLENLLISGIGVTFGAGLTIAFSIAVTTLFNMPAMAWYYTPIGMLVLILLGQLSVLGPSSRAAGTDPAIATRSV